MIRRAFDLAVAAAALALSAPLLAVAVIAIRLESPGSAIYRQRRVGRDGAQFEVRKLRTMVAGAERIGAGLAVDDGDARITRVGALLRRSSLDELPNLWNVLRGEMSLIGPRPTVPSQVALYTDRQRGRLAVKPGLTGWAQVNGRAALPWSERIELDLHYIEHRFARARPAASSRAQALRAARQAAAVYRGPTGGWDGAGGTPQVARQIERRNSSVITMPALERHHSQYSCSVKALAIGEVHAEAEPEDGHETGASRGASPRARGARASCRGSADVADQAEQRDRHARDIRVDRRLDRLAGVVLRGAGHREADVMGGGQVAGDDRGRSPPRHDHHGAAARTPRRPAEGRRATVANAALRSTAMRPSSSSDRCMHRSGGRVHAPPNDGTPRGTSSAADGGLWGLPRVAHAIPNNTPDRGAASTRRHTLCVWVALRAAPAGCAWYRHARSNT